MGKPLGTILVTGANGGLGSALVSGIAHGSLGRDYYGAYTVRNPARADAITKILAKAPEHEHTILSLDLSSLAKVRESAANVNKLVADGSMPPIRALILNAAVQEATSLTMTDDGFDTNFQVNYLSHFLFTLLVLQSMDKDRGRILILGSWCHDVEDPRNDVGPMKGAYGGKWTTLFPDVESLARGRWSTPQDDPSLQAGYRRYGASKLCEVMFMHSLQARLIKDPTLSNIAVLCLDPAAMPSEILRSGPWVTRVLIGKVVLPYMAPLMSYFQPNGDIRTPATSATHALNACFETGEPFGERPRGLLMSGGLVGKASKESRDEKKQAELWKHSMGFVSLKAGDTVLKDWR